MNYPFAVLLGTGTPNAEPDRSGPSVALVGQRSAIIVDCGPGVVRRAVAAADTGIPQLRPERLETVLLTHLHSDHTLGLPDMIFTPWVLDRKGVLDIIGPPGTRRMVDLILEAYSEDVRERTKGLQPSGTPGPSVSVMELVAETTLSLPGMEVTAFPVSHGGLPSYAYRFSCGDRNIAVSGDTAPFDGIERVFRDCNIIIHEVYSARGLDSRPEEWKKYHRSVHTSAPELAGLARKVEPGHLVLYHQLLFGVDEEELMEEIGEVYGGRVSYGRDLDTYS